LPRRSATSRGGLTIKPAHTDLKRLEYIEHARGDAIHGATTDWRTPTRDSRRERATPGLSPDLRASSRRKPAWRTNSGRMQRRGWDSNPRAALRRPTVSRPLGSAPRPTHGRLSWAALPGCAPVAPHSTPELAWHSRTEPDWHSTPGLARIPLSKRDCTLWSGFSAARLSPTARLRIPVAALQKALLTRGFRRSQPPQGKRKGKAREASQPLGQWKHELLPLGADPSRASATFTSGRTPPTTR